MSSSQRPTPTTRKRKNTASDGSGDGRVGRTTRSTSNDNSAGSDDSAGGDDSAGSDDDNCRYVCQATADCRTIRAVCKEWKLRSRDVVELNSDRMPGGPTNEKLRPSMKIWTIGSEIILSKAGDNEAIEGSIEDVSPVLVVAEVPCNLAFASPHLPAPSLVARNLRRVAFVHYYSQERFGNNSPKCGQPSCEEPPPSAWVQ